MFLKKIFNQIKFFIFAYESTACFLIEQLGHARQYILEVVRDLKSQYILFNENFALNFLTEKNIHPLQMQRTRIWCTLRRCTSTL